MRDVAHGHPYNDFLSPRRWPVAGLGLAALALLVLLWQGSLALRDFNALQSQRAGLVSLQRQASAVRPPAMSAEDSKRHRLVEALAAYMATPWDSLLGLFEVHASARVVLSKFLPDASEGRVEVSGRAYGSAALADYLLALEHDPRLRGVLLHHHEVQRGEADAAANAPIDFTLGAAWGDAAQAKSTPLVALTGQPR